MDLSDEIQEDSLDEGSNHTMHIFMLNEYCLLEIFEYLKIEEVFRMEVVCMRFKEISQRIYRITRKLNINELYKSHVTIPEAMKITKRVGSYIHNLSVEDCAITLKKGEIPVFTPLEESISDAKLEPTVDHEVECYEDEPFDFRSLKNAQIVLCQITDEEFSYLLPLEQLEVLDVMATPINPNFLKCLKNITEINFKVPWNSKVFKEFCEATPNLRGLDLISTPILPENLKVIATSLRKLEKLTLVNNYIYFYASQEDFRDIADLPKLKQLTLCEFDYRTHNELNDTIIDLRQFLLLVSYHKRIEILNYSFHYKNMEFSAINKALGNLTNLKKFNTILENADPTFLENILANFTAKHKLEKLIILSTPNIATKPIEMLIKRCPTIRMINVSFYPNVDMNFLNNLRDCLSQRYHVLEIRLPKEQQMECEDIIKGSVIKNLKLVFNPPSTKL